MKDYNYTPESLKNFLLKEYNYTRLHSRSECSRRELFRNVIDEFSSRIANHLNVDKVPVTYRNSYGHLMNGCYDLKYKEIYLNTSDNRTLEDILITLSHEYVHVKDHQNGSLKLVENYLGVFIEFNGVLYQLNVDNVFKSSIPWEIEPYQRQEEIFRNVLEEIDFDVSLVHSIVPDLGSIISSPVTVNELKEFFNEYIKYGT